MQGRFPPSLRNFFAQSERELLLLMLPGTVGALLSISQSDFDGFWWDGPRCIFQVFLELGRFSVPGHVLLCRANYEIRTCFYNRVCSYIGQD